MRRPQGLGAWIPEPAYLPKTPGWAGYQGGSPCVDGLLPPPFLTLTLAPVWDGESAPPRPPPSMAAQPEKRPGCSVAPPGQAPWSTLSAFLYYSVTFFYFTLITIIQEYYLSAKFRVSFLICNFLLC